MLVGCHHGKYIICNYCWLNGYFFEECFMLKISKWTCKKRTFEVQVITTVNPKVITKAHDNLYKYKSWKHNFFHNWPLFYCNFFFHSSSLFSQLHLTGSINSSTPLAQPQQPSSQSPPAINRSQAAIAQVQVRIHVLLRKQFLRQIFLSLYYFAMFRSWFTQLYLTAANLRLNCRRNTELVENQQISYFCNYFCKFQR